MAVAQPPLTRRDEQGDVVGEFPGFAHWEPDEVRELDDEHAAALVAGNPHFRLVIELPAALAEDGVEVTLGLAVAEDEEAPAEATPSDDKPAGKARRSK